MCAVVGISRLLQCKRGRGHQDFHASMSSGSAVKETYPISLRVNVSSRMTDC